MLSLCFDLIPTPAPRPAEEGTSLELSRQPFPSKRASQPAKWSPLRKHRQFPQRRAAFRQREPTDRWQLIFFPLVLRANGTSACSSGLPISVETDRPPSLL